MILMRLALIGGCFRISSALARRADSSITANNPAIFALARHAAVVGAAATGSLKNARKIVRLGSGAALVGDDGQGGGFVGKGRSREEKKEECSGESFHGGLPDEIFVSITFDGFNLAN
jgi:hypothetical protein